MATAAEISKQFDALEMALRTLVSTDKEHDYNRLAAYLALAKDIHNIGLRFRSLIAPNRAGGQDFLQDESRSTSRCSSSQKKLAANFEEELPLYFVSNDKLYKLGSAASSEDAVYKKAVPLVDVERVCEGVATALRNNKTITVTEVKNMLRDDSFREYKVQVTIMALVAASVLQQFGRGRYGLSDRYKKIPDKKTIMQDLQGLPVRNDLLALYK